MFLTWLGFENQSAVPDTPGAGYCRIYTKTDKQVYMVDEDGAECMLAPVIRSSTDPPAAAAGYQGVFHFKEGAAGVADVLTVCVKGSDDGYSWMTVGLS